MKAYKTRYFVRNNQGFGTGIDVLVVIRFKLSHRNIEPIQALSNACTHWAMHTTTGAKEFENSSWDFNVGDFLSIRHEPSLQKILVSEGIEEIDLLGQYTPEQVCPFDKVLIEDIELNKGVGLCM